jgi:hypothetical protein
MTGINNNDIHINATSLQRTQGNTDRRRVAQNPEAAARTRRINKQQYFGQIIPHHQKYPMKRSSNGYVNKQFNNTLFQNVNTAVRQTTEVVYRTQLFLLDCALHYPNNISPALLSMNGVYSVTQLVRGRPITSTNRGFPKDSTQQHWVGPYEANSSRSHHTLHHEHQGNFRLL